MGCFVAIVFVFGFQGISHNCLDKVKPMNGSKLISNIIIFVFQKANSIKWKLHSRISKLEVQITFRRLVQSSQKEKKGTDMNGSNKS